MEVLTSQTNYFLNIRYRHFLVETKTNDTTEEEEIQCCRERAAIVRCTRQPIEDTDPDASAAQFGPDLGSLAFYLALVSACAHIS